MIPAWRAHVEAGHRIIELWPARGRVCGCGNGGCENAGKHPRYTHWPTTPVLDEDTVDDIEDRVYAHGYGVLCAGLLVVDVDVRNGGHESLARLEDAIGPLDSGYIVETGSADGSTHYYFEAPKGVPLQQNLKDYPGIDFKSSGFVVGAESLHKSGHRYVIRHGDPYEIRSAPSALIELLKKPASVRALVGDRVCDVAMSDIRDAVGSLSTSTMGYNEWLRVGMALHHATGGGIDGLDLWDQWSQTAPDKYTRRADLEYKWGSFGKSSNPVTIGTLFAWAHECGWVRPEHMRPAEISLDDLPNGSPPIDIRGVDLLSPPGFVGEVARWIDSQCMFPRPRLVSAAALYTVGNIVGLSYEGDVTGETANLMIFCIAASASGKEAVGQAVARLHVAAGLSPAVHGAIKSTQELTRNLIAHQSAYYMLDELGIMLSQIVNAQRRGGAPYLDGIIGDLMKIYSKADGVYLVSGDVKRQAQEAVQADIRALKKQLDDSGPNPRIKERIARTQRALDALDAGIDRPLLSLIGYSTESTFSQIMSYDQATSGFLGRALLVRETDDNPLPRPPSGVSREVPAPLAATLEILAHGQTGAHIPRIEMRSDKRQRITTEPDAREMLERVRLWTITHLAADHQESSGLTAIARRCYEQIAKISLVLAAPSGVRTMEHVRWATAYAVRDVREKVREVIASESDGAHALHAAVLSAVGTEPVTLAVVRNARSLRKSPAGSIEQALRELVDAGRLIEGERPDRRSKGKMVKTYARADD